MLSTVANFHGEHFAGAVRTDFTPFEALARIVTLLFQRIEIADPLGVTDAADRHRLNNTVPEGCGFFCGDNAVVIDVQLLVPVAMRREHALSDTSKRLNTQHVPSTRTSHASQTWQHRLVIEIRLPRTGTSTNRGTRHWSRLLHRLSSYQTILRPIERGWVGRKPAPAAAAAAAARSQS